MVDIKIMQSMETFQSLTEEELGAVAALMEEQSVSAGDRIFKEDDQDTSLYIIAEGEVELTQHMTEDIEKSLVVLEAGTVFGEMALVDPGGRTATATAKSDAKLLVLPRRKFFDLALSNNAIGIKVFLNLAILLTERLRTANENYRMSMIWGLQISGATHMNFSQLITNHVRVSVELLTDKKFDGVLLKVEQTQSGHEMTFMDDDGNILVIPYHAIACIGVGSAK